MVNFNWKSGVSGYWGTKGNWVQDAVPNSTTANVTVSSSSAIAVTIAASETVTADSVTLDFVGVTLDVAGLLNLGGAKDQLLINAGSLYVAAYNQYRHTQAGTIASGTINAGTGTVTLGDGATLDGITFKGTLDAAKNDSGGGRYASVVNVNGGLRGLNPTGSTIDLTGYYQQLIFQGDQTVNDVGINLGGPSQGGSPLKGKDSIFAGTLTLGNGTTINSSLTSGPSYANYLGGTLIVNDGIINATDSILRADAQTFVNAGSINVDASSQLGIYSDFQSDGGQITAAGTVLFGGGATISLASLEGISLAGSGVMVIGNAHGSVNLNLGGGTLAVAGTDYIEIARGGTVSNGTLDSGRGTLNLGFGTLDDITYKGNLNIIASEVYVIGALNVENASGVGPGTINISGQFGEIEVKGNATLDNVGINLLGGGTDDADEVLSESGGILTLGSQATVNSSAGSGVNTFGGSSIVNQGVVNVNGGQLDIDVSSFTNAGTINISAGSALSIQQGTFTNSGLIKGKGTGTANVYVSNDVLFTDLFGTKLTGGEFEANAGDTLALNLNGVTIANDGGLLILNGAGSEIDTGDNVALESTLKTIGGGGTLKVTGGRGYTTSNTLDINGGKLLLGGGTFSAASLNLAAKNSSVIGDGTLDGPITNAGAILANAGTLVIDGSLTGAGYLRIDAASTLELTTGTSENITFAGTGSLHSALILEAPTVYTGTLSGLAAGDSIDLAGELASSASISGTSLLVTLTNHTVLDYTLASTTPPLSVSVGTDGGSGSELTFNTPPAAPAMQFLQPPAASVTAASASPSASLPALRDLWSNAANYRPSFAAHSGQASFTNPQNLHAELGNMPTPANAGIVLPGQPNWEFSRSPYHDLALAPPKG